MLMASQVDIKRNITSASSPSVDRRAGDALEKVSLAVLRTTRGANGAFPRRAWSQGGVRAGCYRIGTMRCRAHIDVPLVAAAHSVRLCSCVQDLGDAEPLWQLAPQPPSYC